MARVNHKKVKQLIFEKRSKITDRQFFTSRILAIHFEDIAMAQTRRYQYSRRIHVNLFWKPKVRTTAQTDNLVVTINAGNKWITRHRKREERYEIICGLFTHELGHCLFTDFLTAQTYSNYLEAYQWYPEPPRLKRSEDVRSEKELWDYVREDRCHLEMLQLVAHHISNVLEDGYVESRMLAQFPGKLGYCLTTLRNQQWEEMPTVTQMIEQEEEGERHIFDSLLQMMLSYVKFGEIKYGEEPLSDERIQTIFGLLPEMDQALINSSGKDRWKVVNQILVRCWDYIKDYIELYKKRHEEAEAAGTSTASAAEGLSEALETLAGTSSVGCGDCAPVTEEAPSAPMPNAEKMAQTKAKAKENKSADEESEAESGTDGAENEAASQTDSEEESGTSKQEVASEETGRIPYHQTERVSEPVGGSIERNDDYTPEGYDAAASDIERLLDKMAERAACTQLENERLRELNEVAKGISYGNVHAGVSIQVNRISEVKEEMVEQYDAISGPLLTISRQLQKSLMQQLKDQRRGGKQTGLIMGRRLDAHALCRNDGKVFYKNALPNEIPEIAVGLLLDESGSMCSYDRATYARASAIILYDFCRSLDIPVMVYGHSTSDAGVMLYSYAEFESIDRDDKYRMMDISARENNRDGAALRFVAEQLSKRPEEVKLLILVSDGQPADYGYLGSAAEEDLRGIQQEYRRKGILFIAAAIGSDKQNIERIYGDSFMDITDLSKLPVKLTSAVKRHIRV